MRHSLLLLCVIAASSSCTQMQHGKATEEILSFIPGSYVRTFEGPFAIGRDTLIISQPAGRDNYYTIRHNSSFQRIIESKLQPIEYKSQNWTAIFNETQDVLVEQKYGKLISFLPAEGELLLGNNRYYKIK